MKNISIKNNFKIRYFVEIYFIYAIFILAFEESFKSALGIFALINFYILLDIYFRKILLKFNLIMRNLQFIILNIL